MAAFEGYQCRSEYAQIEVAGVEREVKFRKKQTFHISNDGHFERTKGV